MNRVRRGAIAGFLSSRRDGRTAGAAGNADPMSPSDESAMRPVPLCRIIPISRILEISGCTRPDPCEILSSGFTEEFPETGLKNRGGGT
jgi:hypothetical protein